jgi:hypothetical protein
MAMYASQDIGWIGPDGRREIVGERRALAPGGACCNGRIMDCQVDYLQLCHRASALRIFPDGEYWPEDKATEDHADGLFMEKLGRFFEILPIDVKIGQNRRTPWSINVPAGWPTISAGASEYLSPGHARSVVHETIMDAWALVRSHLDHDSRGTALQKALNDFQGQLRELCEQDHAQRRRLVSERYRLADRLHTLLAWIPGSRRISKYCQHVLTKAAHVIMRRQTEAPARSFAGASGRHVANR